jgi:hypothetical protein
MNNLEVAYNVRVLYFGSLQNLQHKGNCQHAALSTVSISNSLLIKNRAAWFNKIPIGFFVEATASTGTQSTKPYRFSTCLIDSGKGK